MNKKFRFFILVIINLAFTLSAKAVPTLSEFRQEISLHRGRVQVNAKKIVENFPGFFPNLMTLPKEVREKFLQVRYSAHDLPKLMTLTELKKLGYKSEVPLDEKLHQAWGHDLKKQPRFIKQLNEVEDHYRELITNQNFSELDPQLLKRIIKEANWAEMIADYTDAKINRGPELGVEMKPFDTAVLFDYFKHDQKAAAAATWLEVTVYKRSSLVFCSEHFAVGK